ncbi:hypothetical protein PPTG_03174 [Phytophthora nicotianae INRA-310]|uniref:Uncharacterized protein n=1 Tax=Phytophthora nicotianae (strain INRA-310) TaxID=761204 RepID=W2R3T8_PHYN3|nr:hypothetical protein PPTG_03174 [Phytophthora nicotianae INRA-310]ETN20092.1 hypothetical protein PPTG_03174 [Phytophthora nicotianae INRA-310]
MRFHFKLVFYFISIYCVFKGQRQTVKHVATLPSVEAAIGLMALPLMVEDGKASSGLGSAAGSVSDGGSNSSGEGSKRSVKSAEMTARAAHALAGKVAKSQRRREVYKLRVRQAAHARKFKKSKKN